MMRKHSVAKWYSPDILSLRGATNAFCGELAVNTPDFSLRLKKAAEVMAYSYHYLFDIDVSVVRYFTVYGPAGRPT
jgi:nucleoside-diphosphate-sugar epimerase